MALLSWGWGPLACCGLLVLCHFLRPEGGGLEGSGLRLAEEGALRGVTQALEPKCEPAAPSDSPSDSSSFWVEMGNALSLIAGAWRGLGACMGLR